MATASNVAHLDRGCVAWHFFLMTMSKLSKKVLALLKERGMSQAVLAQLASMDRGHLNRVLRSKRAWTAPVLEQVARALDSDPATLAAGTDEEALLQANGATVEREYVEQVATELAKAAARVQELEAVLASERTTRSKLEHELAQARAESAKSRLERDTMQSEAASARTALEAQNRQLAVTQQSSSEMQTQIDQGRAQLKQLMVALQAANRQIVVNYDAWQQADARARQLAAQLEQKGGQTAVAALFAGLIGLGVGVAASANDD